MNAFQSLYVDLLYPKRVSTRQPTLIDPLQTPSFTYAIHTFLSVGLLLVSTFWDLQP